MKTIQQRCNLIFTLLVFVVGTGTAHAALVHRWTFDDGTANDSAGTAHGTLYNGASISGGQLHLDGVNDYFRTGPIAETLSARTLMVWVTLSNLTQQAGSALTLENPTDNDVFDGIIYGEQEANRWINGSDNALRWDFSGGTEASPAETSLDQVWIAIVYGDPTSSPNNIKIYRNGVLYNDYTPGNPRITYPAGVADVLIGVRHSDLVEGTGTAEGFDEFLAGSVDEARIYDTALTADQIAGLSSQSAAYAVAWFTVDGGGGTSTGGVYAVSDTLGQPDAGGLSSGGSYSLTGGFWPLPGAVERQAPGSLIVYDDALVNGWQDWGYNSTRDFANQTPVRSGTHSLAVTITDAYGGAQFYHTDLTNTPFTHITFWIHGGVTGDQNLQLYGLLHAGGEENQVQPQRYLLNPLPANTWQQFAVPLSALGVANATNFSGFVIQDSAGTGQPVFYLDEIQLANIPAVTLLGAAMLTNECHTPFTDPGATTAGAQWAVLVSGSIDVNTPGEYTFTYSTANAVGLLGTVTRTVVVQDTLPPVIALQGLNPLKVFLNKPFVDPGATALDACGGSVAMTTNRQVNLAVPGIYTITYSATDSSGNTGVGKRTVIVTVPPTFAGNGNAGFSGAVGQGSLVLTDNGTTISGTFTKGPGDFNDLLVLYLDTEAGGFTNTLGFADAGDLSRVAISGFDGVNRSVLNFLPGFAPDYGMVIGPTFGGIWQLANGGDWSHPFISSVNLSSVGGATAGTYTFSFPVTDIGLVPNTGAGFRFFGTYISTTGYRSTEALPGNVSGTQGWNPFSNTAVASYSIQGPVILITGSSFDPTSREMTLSWTSTPGAVYSVLHSTNLAAAGGGFSPLAGSVASGGNTTSTTVTLPAGPVGFVRILLPNLP